MAGLPWVSVGDNCRLTQCWRSAILSDFGAPPRQRTPRPLKCELRPHLRKSWRGRVHCQGRAKRARRVALTVDSSPPIHTQEGEADPSPVPLSPTISATEPETLQSQHRTESLFHAPMILFNRVVQVLTALHPDTLRQLAGPFPIGHGAVRSGIGIQRDFGRSALLAHCFA